MARKAYLPRREYSDYKIQRKGRWKCESLRIRSSIRFRFAVILNKIGHVPNAWTGWKYAILLKALFGHYEKFHEREHLT